MTSPAQEPQHPSVGPIVIADTLITQFRGVNRSLAAGVESLGADGASVHIAEGNRIYPGIWEHLDQAHATIGSSASGPDQYASIRSGANTLIGVFDLAQERTATLRGTKDVFTWKLNEDGLRLADRASRHLKSRLPFVQWDEAHRAAEVDFVDLQSGAKTLKLIRIGLIVLAILAVVLMAVL